MVTQTIFALTFAVSSVGQTVLFTTDSGKATAAGRRVYDLIDRVSFSFVSYLEFVSIEKNPEYEFASVLK